jgi:hypothetical protein
MEEHDELEPQNEQSGLGTSDHEAMELIIKAFNLFANQPGYIHPDDLDDFRRAIHDIQRILAGRVVARDYPEYWR